MKNMLVSAAVSLLIVPSIAFPINFNAPRAYGFGNNYAGTGLAVADFNGDGLADAAVTLSESGLEIFLATTGSRMVYKTTYTVNGLTYSTSVLAVADFNHDGKPDLAAVTTAGVAILLGNGDGTFAAPVTYSAGTGPFSVVTADFNHDGSADLAVVNTVSNNVSILLGNGDGTFLPAVNYAVGIDPEYLAVGDFNGDGKPDLAVTNYARGKNAGTVSILFGTGDGTFGRAVNYLTGLGPQSIAVGDFNGDGQPDLAITLFEGKVAILLAGGGGTFLAPAMFDAGPNPGSVIVLDVNQDGKLDLAVANQLEVIDNAAVGGYTASVMNGNGDGTFQPPATYYVAGSQISKGSATTIAIGDFNGDGNVDLAATGSALSILLATGKGSFEQPVCQSTGDKPTSVATGDFNGDGVPDLAIADSGANSISILLGKGDGSFEPQAFYDPGGDGSGIVVVGDFNGDGKPDLAVAVKKGVTIMLGNGDGTFQTGYFAIADTVFSLVAADMNLDGKLDLVSDSFVALGDGAGHFKSPQWFNGSSIDFFSTVGNFTSDGIPDVAVSLYTDAGYYSDYQIDIMLGTGTGTFAGGSAVGGPADTLAVGDFNHDGNLDLVSGEWIALGNGNGTFQNQVYLPFGDVLGVADFNSDGNLDMLTGGIQIALGNGDGTFQTTNTYFITPGSYAISAVIADFNGDGKPDIAIVGGPTNTVTILTNTTR